METTDIPTLLNDNPEGSFLEFGSFNGKSFGTCRVTGLSPGWEMHPATDEFFYVIEGGVEITLLESGGNSLPSMPSRSVLSERRLSRRYLP